MNPSSSDPLRQIEEAIHDGKIQEARAQLVDYIKRDPNYDRAWWLLAFTLTDLNQQVDCLKRVLHLNPDHTQAREWLAKLKKTGSLPPLKPAVNPFFPEPDTGSQEEELPPPPVLGRPSEKQTPPPASSMWPAPERKPSPSVEETLFPNGQTFHPAPATPPPDTTPPVWTLPEDERPEPPMPVKSAPNGKQAQKSTPPQGKKPKKKKSRIWAILLVLFLLCVVVTAGGAYWVSQQVGSFSLLYEQAMETLQAQMTTPTWTVSPTPTLTSTPTITPTSTATATVSVETPAPASDSTPMPSAIPDDQIGPNVSLFAPTFTLTDFVTGEEVSLDQFAGQPMVVFFWKTNCLPCQGEFTNLETFYQNYQQDGLVILAINVGEDAAAVESFLAERSVTFRILMDVDEAVSQLYKVDPLPAHFFINKSGRITYAAPGMMNKGEMEWQITIIVR